MIGPKLVWPMIWGLNQAHQRSGDVTFFTSDSYVFASIVQKSALKLHETLTRVQDVFFNGWITSIPHVLIEVLNFPFGPTLFYISVAFSLCMSFGILGFCCHLKMSPLAAIGGACWASWSWIFYQRTSAGYYDTDGLAVGWPLICLLVFSKSTQQKYHHWKTLLASLLMSCYPFAYTKGVPLGVATLLCIAIWSFFQKKDHSSKDGVSFLLMAILLPFMREWFWGLTILYTLLFTLIHSRFSQNIFSSHKTWSRALKVSLVPLGLLLIWQSGALSRIHLYLDLDHTELMRGPAGQSGNFIYSMTSGQEAIPISFMQLGTWTAGHWIMLVMGLCFWIKLSWKDSRALWLAPWGAIGFFSLLAGGRFSLYLVPLVFIGLAHGMDGLFKCFNMSRVMKALMGVIVIIGYGAFLLWPSMKHEPKPFVSKGQVQALTSMEGVMPPNSKVLNWWDDSFVISFYSKLMPVMPYNSFGGELNHWMAKLLLSPPSENTQRWSEYLAKPGGAARLTQLATTENKNVSMDNLGLFNFPTPERAIYLPFELLLKLGNIQRFKQLKVHDESAQHDKGFLIFRLLEMTEQKLIFDQHYTLDRVSFTLLKDDQHPLPFGKAHILTHDSHGVAHVKSSTFNTRYHSDLLFIPKRKLMILMERDFFNSLVVQMGILHRYNANFFEAITLKPDVAIYRWKSQRNAQN